MLLLPGSMKTAAVLCVSLFFSPHSFVSGTAIKRFPSAPSSSSFPETAGVQPIPCHSHNDYLRDHPLIEALHNGCTSVEADIWQRNDMKDDLRVGHTSSTLKDDRTLKSLYVDPIVKRLEAVNSGRQLSPAVDAPWKGIFLTSPAQSLVLLIDFKTGDDATWSTLMSALEPLRDGGWLSYWDIKKGHFQPGAVTLVASGKATLDEVNGGTVSADKGNPERRDIFLDAPLADLGTTNEYNTMNSFYASTKYESSLNSDKVKAQIAAAKALHLKSRYWGAPDARGSLQQIVLWQELLKDDAGIFNTNHLITFRKWWESQHKS